MISKEDINHLAALARINLTNTEIESLQNDLQRILTYVDALKQVNTEGLPEIAQVTGLKNSNREDVVVGCDADTRERILKAMPAAENDYLKVKAVFE